MNSYKKFFLILISFILILGCDPVSENTTSRLRITLVDMPADYESVNVDIREVRIHTSNEDNDEENDSGWTSLPDSDFGVINLFDYTNGNELVIYDDDYPSGYVSQIRLVLGEDNTVVIDGDSIKLKTPSAQQSGLKLKINQTLEPGIAYNFKLDFEASRSVVKTGNEKYILKPVIRVNTEIHGGSIKGIVMPEEENVNIYVIDNDDTIASTIAIEGLANFLISNIAEGSYTVSFATSEDSDYAGKVENEVSVLTNQVTDMGTIELSLK